MRQSRHSSAEAALNFSVLGRHKIPPPRFRVRRKGPRNGLQCCRWVAWGEAVGGSRFPSVSACRHIRVVTRESAVQAESEDRPFHVMHRQERPRHRLNFFFNYECQTFRTRNGNNSQLASTMYFSFARWTLEKRKRKKKEGAENILNEEKGKGMREDGST